MKFIVTKITQIEDAALVEADTDVLAVGAYQDGYHGYTETKRSEISKITVQAIPETTPQPVAEEVPTSA